MSEPQILPIGLVLNAIPINLSHTHSAQVILLIRVSGNPSIALVKRSHLHQSPIGAKGEQRSRLSFPTLKEFEQLKGAQEDPRRKVNAQPIVEAQFRKCDKIAYVGAVYSQKNQPY